MIRKLSLVLVTLLPVGVLVSACATEVSTTTQGITCATDPGTGVILRCEPFGITDPSADEATPEGSCLDIDTDGDGDPHDEGTILRVAAAGDADGDGVPDASDCDEHPGEDDCDGGSTLPYDIKPQVGETTTPILDAFAEKGSRPEQIVSVTMDDGTWRLAELKNSTPFTVTAADCSHAGNRDTGRDRVVVTWLNTDGTTASDHLDLRYCD